MHNQNSNFGRKYDRKKSWIVQKENSLENWRFYLLGPKSYLHFFSELWSTHSCRHPLIISSLNKNEIFGQPRFQNFKQTFWPGKTSREIYVSFGNIRNFFPASSFSRDFLPHNSYLIDLSSAYGIVDVRGNGVKVAIFFALKDRVDNGSFATHITQGIWSQSDTSIFINMSLGSGVW